MAILQRWTDKITNSNSFKFKPGFVDEADNTDTVKIKIVVTLKYLNNFWKTLEMLSITCKIKFYFNLFS